MITISKRNENCTCGYVNGNKTSGNRCHCGKTACDKCICPIHKQEFDLNKAK